MRNCYLKDVCNRCKNGDCFNDCLCYEPESSPEIEDTRKEYICPVCNFEWKTTEVKNVMCACGNKMEEKYYAIS